MSKHHAIITSIRAAFENIKVAKSAYTEKGAIIGSIISDALHKKAGIMPRADWNASLSFKTFKLLNGPVFDRNGHVGKANAYDRMVQV